MLILGNTTYTLVPLVRPLAPLFPSNITSRTLWWSFKMISDEGIADIRRGDKQQMYLTCFSACTNENLCLCQEQRQDKLEI